MTIKHHSVTESARSLVMLFEWVKRPLPLILLRGSSSPLFLRWAFAPTLDREPAVPNDPNHTCDPPVRQVAQETAAPGVSTAAVDAAVHRFVVAAGGYPVGINFHGFPRALCSSVNNVVVHGIPDERPLESRALRNTGALLGRSSVSKSWNVSGGFEACFTRLGACMLFWIRSF